MPATVIYTGFEVLPDEVTWPRLGPIMERVESHFKDKCVEVTLAAFRSSHFVAHFRLSSGAGYIARVDFSIMGPTTSWKMASEVATIKYLQEKTSIPIPKVYMYDEDEDGTVGGPWMVMDYVRGPDLLSVWCSMTTDQRKKVYSSVADIWAQLLSLRFTSIGSLHFPEHDSGEIALGPVAVLSSNRVGDVSAPLRSNCGPFPKTVDWLRATARRDLSYDNVKYPLTEADYENINATLETIERNAFFFDGPNANWVSSIALKAVDFRPHNVIVSPDDPTKIVGVIDWEGARTSHIWNISSLFFNVGMISDPQVFEETEALEIYLQDEIARRSPLWAEGRERGQLLRDLAKHAEFSMVQPGILSLPRDYDLRSIV